jgi:hypothetical protein
MNILNFGGSITLVCGTLMAFAGGPANAAPVKNIVLVHGAFADGSGWKAVYEILVNDGYNVTAAQPPLTEVVYLVGSGLLVSYISTAQMDCVAHLL